MDSINDEGVDVQACQQLQEDEITVLESIYPTLLTVHPNPEDKPGRLLTLSIPITLPTSISVILVNANPHAAESSSQSHPTLEILHLPALTLRLFLPPSYPLSGLPKPTSLRASLSKSLQNGDWLSRSVLKDVRDRMAEMWREERDVTGEGSGVIWRWWDWVGNGDFLSDLNLMQGCVLNLTIPPSLPSSSFHTLLKTYHAQQLHTSFESTAFSCSICLENRKGKSCIELPGCSCVFCIPCLSSCWSLAITEGTLDNVSCPSVSCVKSRATRDSDDTPSIGVDRGETDPELVEGVVGRDLRIRWEKLKERRKAEIDPTYTVCPRPTCQASVPPPPVSAASTSTSQNPPSKRAIRLSEISNPSSTATTIITPFTETPPTDSQNIPEDRWARYRLCPTCNFSFCLYCSATWHGPHTPCSFPSTNLLVQEYLSYSEGSEGRKKMEMKKGKVNLERMVRQWREDEGNRKWLEERTRACAGCGVRVEKSHGCNHMTCERCTAHFCYRCGSSISKQDPYAHYRNPSSDCYEKLFDQEEIERFNRETVGGVAGDRGVEGVWGVAEGEVGFGEEDWRDIRGFWEW